MADPPTQHSSQQPVQPSPHLVQGAGQINNSDEAFNLRQRMYPLPLNTSMTAPTAAMPLSSGRLLDTEEGWVDPPPPCHRESHLREQTMHWGPLGPPPDRMYSGDARFGYDGIVYHIGMNHPLYDPSGRGQDAPAMALIPHIAYSCPHSSTGTWTTRMIQQCICNTVRWDTDPMSIHLTLSSVK